MDAQQFAAEKKSFTSWITRLSGGQVDEMRMELAQCTSLADCIAIIEERGKKLLACPHCNGVKLYRHGVYYGLQRYRCRQCTRSFNALTNTPLAFIRLREKWLPFLRCMLDSMTVRAAAEAISIHRNTSFRWRHRFLAMAKEDRPKPLGGIVEVDETYLLESQKGSRHLTRPPRRRGGRSRRRGINCEHDCIVIARARSGQTCDFVTGRGPVTKVQLHACLPPVLAAGVILATDGAAAYRAFADEARIEHRPVNLRQGVRVDGIFHVQNVNNYHSRFRNWLLRFHGVASRYLSHYLGWTHELTRRRDSTPQLFLRAALLPAGI